MNNDDILPAIAGKGIIVGLSLYIIGDAKQVTKPKTTNQIEGRWVYRLIRWLKQ